MPTLSAIPGKKEDRMQRFTGCLKNLILPFLARNRIPFLYAVSVAFAIFRLVR
jgi:hypothetical protein